VTPHQAVVAVDDDNVLTVLADIAPAIAQSKKRLSFDDDSAVRANGSARGSAYRVGKTPRCFGRGTWWGPSKLRIIGEMREIETFTRISADDPPSSARGSEHPVQRIHWHAHDGIGSIGAMLCRCEPGNAHDPRGRLDGVTDILHTSTRNEASARRLSGE
jgi:hypothetical protein